MKTDSLIDTILRIVIGFGIFLGIIALIALFSGNAGAFFGIAVIGAGFAGLGWAGRQLLLPAKQGKAPRGVGTVVGIIFGGAGVVMLIGSVILFIQGEFGGAIGLCLFGLVFCGAGYAGYRIFTVPKGKKVILVTERWQHIRGVFGQTGQRRSQQYVYVDKDVPDTEIERMQHKWAERPWTQRNDWANGKVVQEGPGSIRLLVGFTIAWNVICWGITATAILSEWGKNDMPWFMLVFPLIGIGLALITLRIWIRRRKFGISIFHLETVPGYLGERLRGTVETGVPTQDEPVDGFRVQFVCAKRSSYRDSKGDRRVSEENLWSDEQYVQSRFSDTSRTLNVSIDFAVPPDLPPTELIPKDNRILWRLEVFASVPGVDYTAQFEVPVFRRDMNTPTKGVL